MIKVEVWVYNKFEYEHKVAEKWVDCFESGEAALAEMNKFFKTKWGGFKRSGWEWIASNDTKEFKARIWDDETKMLWN